jgi:RNA ligase
MKIRKEDITPFIEDKYITEVKHPQGKLYIYNYTPKAQYERVWTKETLQCRGLILDELGNIVARPFPKFFNLEEYQEKIPNEPFEVYEKLDGSLGILYFYENQPYIATRGSFTSVQASKGNEILYQKYKENFAKLNPQLTYLFEIIYPDNRIVVDYGNKQDLILLAIIETATGQEISLNSTEAEIGFTIAKCYDGIHDIKFLKSLETGNQEGFVIRFQSGLRLKVKFEEYKRLHRILTGVSSKSIWEILKDSKSLEMLLDKVPDEFYQWVEDTKNNLLAEYQVIENQCKEEFKELGDRKETAVYFQTCKYPSILFAMLDRKDYSQAIWKLIKPKFEKPFCVDES